MIINRLLLNFFIMFLVFLSTNLAWSARKISFQGKILKPDGTALEVSAVSFKFSIADPSGSCVLYSEIFSAVDMSSSGGSVVLLLGDGNRSYPTSGGLTVTDAFDNKTTSYTCYSSGSTYAPAVGDGRKLYVQFNDGSSAGSQLLPAMEVTATPYAMYADSATTLGTHTANEFLLKTDVSTCVGQALSYDGTSFSCVATGGSGSGGASGYNFVNTTANSATNITAQPSGTGTSAGLLVYNNSSGVNNSYGSIIAGASAVDIRSSVNGTGTQLPLTFTVGASEAMRFDTSGNMGVGTASPTSKLDLNGALTLRGMAAPAVSAAGQGRIYFDFVANKFKVSQNGAAYVDLLGATNSFVNGGNSFGAATSLGTIDNYNLDIKSNNVTRMTVAANGRVGIGKTNPGYMLDVVGTVSGTQLNSALTTSSGGNYNGMTLDLELGADVNHGAINGDNIYLDSWGVMSPHTVTSMVGSVIDVAHAGNSVTLTTGKGIDATFETYGATTAVTTAYGGKFQTINGSNGGAISTAYGIYTAALQNSTGTIGTGYGLYVGNVQATNKWSIYASDSAAPTYLAGNLGIGLMYPNFNLELGDAIAVDGAILARGYGANGTGKALALTSAGKRMIWYPKKSAFRAGSVSGAQWDDPNIGNNSTAFGYSTTASGDYSVALGNTAAASGVSSVALGSSTTANAAFTLAAGGGTTASSIYATALGNSSTASGRYSVAAGDTNTASDDGAFASGSHTTAGGPAATAMGDSTTATGWSATALGNTTNAAGDHSLAVGHLTTAPAYVQTTVGQYNLPMGTENAANWIATDPLFVVANGTAGGASRSNAIMVLKNGNIGFGVNNPGSKLQVAGVITPSADNTYTLGDVTHRFSDVYSVNAANNTSDAREKKEIQDSDLGLNFITHLRPVSYLWKSGVDRTQHYGLIAQETKTAIIQAKRNPADSTDSPVIVTYDKENDRYGIRYTELISPMIKALQELYAELIGQSSQIEQLKNENIDLKIEIEKQKQENAEMKSRLDKIEKKLHLK